MGDLSKNNSARKKYRNRNKQKMKREYRENLLQTLDLRVRDEGSDSPVEGPGAGLQEIYKTTFDCFLSTGILVSTSRRSFRREKWHKAFV